MAYVLSSVSGNLISAASAGFAPTNSADVSAIASAYQVVSATATQLNAGTAYLTSVNDTPISASRAGHAANASLANSAWYDGTGRFISSLPDEATVSSIASAYAESAASSKQDASAMSAYALSADVSGVIDTVSSNSASWAGGITGDYLTSKVGSGQATFSTALQDGMDKRPALVISAQRNAGSSMYPRMLVTDWNNTTGETHSGALLANAFEFYSCPDSARGEIDPSGIVQSRLDASHLRFSVDPAISAYTKSSEFTRYGMRLGSAGNSASWAIVSGDGPNGGFIILNDGSGTSGRIVASSIPYWNDKLDSSAATGFVDSAYVESAVSGKQDTLTFDWDADSAISSINGSALAGQGGGGGVESISADSNFTGDGSTGSPLGLSSQIATGSWTAGNSGFRTNIINSDSDHFDFAIGKRPNATNTAWTWFGLAALRSADAYALSQCDFIFGSMAGANSANPGIVSGDLYGISAQAHSKGELRFSLKYPSAYINISSVGKYNPQVYAYAGDKSAYIKMSKRVGTASGNSSIYHRAVLDSTYLEFKKYYTGYIDTADTASGTSYLMTTAQMEASSIPYWNAKLDSAEMSAYVAKSAYDDLYSAFTALSGVISQYSGWFSELSSISAKVDNSAIGVTE